MAKETTTKFKADLTELNSAFREAQKHIKAANDEFRASTAHMQNWSKEMGGVEAKITQLGTKFDEEKNKLKNLEKQLVVTREEYKRVSQEQGENSDEAKRLEKSIEKLTEKIAKQKVTVGQTESQLRKYGTKLSDMQSEARQAAKSSEVLFKDIDEVGDHAEKSAGKLEKFKEAAANVGSKMGTGLAGAGKAAAKIIGAMSVAAVGGAAAMGKFSVSSGMDFDKEMSAVKSISGATEEQFTALRDKAKEMGAATSFSATESAQAMEYMAMAGWDAQQMTDGLAGIMNLAAASGEDLASTSDIVTDALTAFGMSAEDSNYFADVLAKTASNANTNVAMMGETFQYVAPLAGAMGYSVEDMSAAIGLMANSGIKGAQAGTALRSIITNLASPTDDVTVAMEELGITLQNQDGTMKTFREVLDDVREGFSGLDEVQKTEYASTIAGKYGMSGFLALINSGKEDFDKLTNAIKNSDGAAKDMADTRLDNLAGDVTLFKSALEGAGIEISDRLSPVLREFVQGATDAIPGLSAYIGDFVGKIAKILSDLIPMIRDIGKEVAPAIGEIFDILKDAMPYVNDIVESVIPLIAPTLETLLVPIRKLVKNFLPPMVDLIENVGKALAPVLKVLSPVVEVISELASLLAGVAVGALSGFLELFVDSEKNVIEFSEAEQAVIDKTKELSQAVKDNEDARKDAIKSVENEYSYYEDLYDELDSLVDANGRVKEGYEERAGVITTLLRDASGIEIEITDGVIQKYDELKDKIWETIEARKYEAMISANQKSYEEALSMREELQDDYYNALTQRSSKYDEKALIVKQMQAMRKEMAGETSGVSIPGAGLTEEEKRSILPSYSGSGDNFAVYKELEERLNGVNEEYLILSDNATTARHALENNEATIRNQEQAIYDLESGNENIGLSLLKVKENFLTVETASYDSLVRQKMNVDKGFSEIKKQYEMGVAGVTEEDVRMWAILAQQSDAQVEAAGLIGSGYTNNIASGMATSKGAVEYAASVLGDAAVSTLSAVDTASVGYAKGRDFANSVIASAQGAIDYINSSISNITGKISVTAAKLPQHATGGIVTRAHSCIVGEDGAEAIVPLEKNTKWIDLVAQKILSASQYFSGASPAYGGSSGNNGGNGGQTVINFTQNNTSPKALSRLEIYRQTKNLLDMPRGGR